MNLQDRIEAFSSLGVCIKNKIENSDKDLSDVIQKSTQTNPWFTEETILFSLTENSKLLRQTSLQNWVENYTIPEKFKPQTIAVITAGNIPLVGFLDVLCVLISGYKIIVKASSKDEILIPYLLQLLIKTYPTFTAQIRFAKQLIKKNFDAIIATGSNNTSRYFESYFGELPHIFRKNRTSIAILSGNESVEELYSLGKDIFTYFGLGCRNVSKIFLPQNYPIFRLKQAWLPYKNLVDNIKYANNYKYNKIIYLMNQQATDDFGFIILQQMTNLFSPIGVLYYEYYPHFEAIHKYINKEKATIQCVVGKNFIPFGESQKPTLCDYSDKVDTMHFLEEV